MIDAPRLPSPARLLRLSALHQSAFDGARGWSAAEIRDLSERGRLIATSDDAGFALIGLAADEAELLTIAVSPNRRRSGLGRLLLAAAEAEARRAGADRIFLEVSEANEAARALYHAFGFTIIGRRPAYYAGADALAMSKPLIAY